MNVKVIQIGMKIEILVIFIARASEEQICLRNWRLLTHAAHHLPHIPR